MKNLMMYALLVSGVQAQTGLLKNIKKNAQKNFKKSSIKVNKVIKLERELYSEKHELKVGMSFNAFSNYDQDENVVVYSEDNVYLDSADSQSNIFLSTNLNVTKNIWNRGRDESFGSYIDAKKDYLAAKNDGLKKRYFSKLKEYIAQYYYFRSSLVLLREKTDFYAMLRRRVTKSVKYKLYPKSSKDYIDLLNDRVLYQRKEVSDKLYLIGEIIATQYGANVFKKVKQLKLDEIKFDKFWVLNQTKECKIFQNKEILNEMRMIDSEVKLAQHASRAKLDLIGSVSATDIDGWESPNVNARVGFSLNIPFGSDDSLVQKAQIKKMQLQKQREDHELQKNYEQKAKSRMLRQAITKYNLNMKTIKKYNKKGKSYYKLFKNGIIQLQAYAKMYNMFYEASLSNLKEKNIVVQAYLEKEFDC